MMIGWFLLVRKSARAHEQRAAAAAQEEQAATVSA